MKLIRFRDEGKEKPGIVLEENYFEASPFGEDYGEAFLENDGLQRLQSFVDENKASLRKLDASVELAAPFQRPSKIICIGLNYADHARETGATPPAQRALSSTA